MVFAVFLLKKVTKIYKYSRLLVCISLFLSACPQPGGNGESPARPPVAPGAPEIKPGNGKLLLTWAAVPGAAAYEVFCGTAKSAVSLAGTVNVPAVVISALADGTTYYVRLRAKNGAGSSSFGPYGEGKPSVQIPSPSVIRGNGALSVGWAAEEGVAYEVWYGTSTDAGAASKWDGNGSVTVSGVTAGTTITGLSNGTYYVWIKTGSGEGENAFGAETEGIPEAPTAPPEGFVYVPGGTVTGSAFYAITVTVPADPAYNFPGSSSVQKGVFVEDRKAPIESFFMAKHETTQELWYTVQQWAVNYHFYHFQNPQVTAPPEADKNKPVTSVNWRDAVVWCNAYSEKSGLKPVYYFNLIFIIMSLSQN